ncbi:AraC family transcriptional regulator [Flavobacteriaceae bacterium F08102]|nr:AraC family transcriptional regulator [Flavobacteriaceae bacterium F08102]
MKVLPFKISKPEKTALVYQEDRGEAFYNKYHQHKEIQLSHIVYGEGTLLIGDSVHHYQAGDFLLIGGNLPHVFRSEVIPGKDTLMYSLFFDEHAFGTYFFTLNEFNTLQPVLANSKYGVKINSHKEVLKKLFLALKHADPLERFILCMKILQTISKANTSRLSSFIYPKNYTDTEGKRMSAVFDYTMQHYIEDIHLAKIAQIANLTPNAFCKYFKQRTNKTYIQFLTELRITFACKLLLKNKDLSIAQVAYQSGFKNISNFNRQFKKQQKMTPLQYRASS